MRSLLALLLPLSPLLGATPSPPPADTSTNSPIRQISETLFEIGNIRFDKKHKTAQFETQVNMNKDLLEYALVCKGGKTHESLLQTRIEPSDLHVVMLLLGATIAPPPPLSSSTNAQPWIDSATLKKAPPLKGSPVTLSLQWKSNGIEKNARIEDWVLNKQTGKPMEYARWVYNGSELIGSYFMAQRERSIAALVTDPFALINHTGKGHDNDALWYANSNQVPVVGTAVLLTIHLETPD